MNNLNNIQNYFGEKAKDYSDKTEEYIQKGLGMYDARQSAINEAKNSKMPGLWNGPADAYRHILVSAEMTRRTGKKAQIYAEGHEILGNIKGQDQTESDMDKHNNAIGYEIVRKAKDWNDVVTQARGKITEGTYNNGTGQRDTPMWLPESKWQKGGNNWPPKLDDIAPAINPKGGMENTYNPLYRDVSTWTDDDVKNVMNSKEYQYDKDVNNKVQDYFKYKYPGEMSFHKGVGEVHVSGYTRMDDGKSVSVSDYYRSRPNN